MLGEYEGTGGEWGDKKDIENSGRLQEILQEQNPNNRRRRLYCSRWDRPSKQISDNIGIVDLTNDHSPPMSLL